MNITCKTLACFFCRVLSDYRGSLEVVRGSGTLVLGSGFRIRVRVKKSKLKEKKAKIANKPPTYLYLIA